MSYSIEIKRQVFRIKQSKCCRFSELYGFMLACGAFAEPGMIKIAVKNEDFFEYYVSLLENICQIDLKAKYVTVKGSRQVTYILQILDPDTALPEFRAKLKAAGIDKVVEEKQRQLDAWLETK